jgi:hypothetical protein
MSANRRRHLMFARMGADSELNDEEMADLRAECQNFLSVFGGILDFSALIHLIIAGCAAGYLLILTSADEFGDWAHVFCRVTQFADFFFYFATVFIFMATFVLAMLLFQVRSSNVIAKVILVICLFFLAVALLLTTMSIPMSMMLNKSISDFGDWYRGPVFAAPAQRQIRDLYQPMTTFRMAVLVFTSPFFAFIVRTIRTETFTLVYKRM